MPYTNETGAVIFLDGETDAAGSRLTLHSRPDDPRRAWLNARSARDGGKRSVVLNPDLARRLARVLSEWADQVEGGR